MTFCVSGSRVSKRVSHGPELTPDEWISFVSSLRKSRSTPSIRIADHLHAPIVEPWKVVNPLVFGPCCG